MLKVFVYGTLKPDGRYHSTYCGDKVRESLLACTRGELFHLVKLGYPAMTEGDNLVKGVLLTFHDESVLTRLDELEDYRSDRSPDENEYQRLKIPVYTLSGESLGDFWGYRMNRDRIALHGGVPVPSGWWTESSWR
ncbi:gamma-glutamylcyclotransferase family protein [Pannus brasiliensis CCIBt3594]|uniref:Gamma-glutamylcyclotransferase family protein n=1 Tax=Pannus brasiliensis CCIBt3594 TaxID=1427578 RepID=A0AAW9QV90_9CHRO